MKRFTPLAVIEKYHAKYLEYEQAYNKEGIKEDAEKLIRELIESGEDEDSDKFVNTMINAVIADPQKRASVNTAAIKFAMFVDYYILTQEDPLPENILTDYEKLPIRETLKPAYSVSGDKLVKNEEVDITPETREYFKAIIAHIKNT